MSACTTVEPESCDAKDNDCDGQVDEKLEQACGSSNTPPCQLGKQTCVAGEWGECAGAVEPKSESCDPMLLDEDCDGTPNEGCECTPGTSMPCGMDRGICKKGTLTCNANGTWGSECAGEQKPQRELCDGKADEDCDGLSDDQDVRDCECVNGAMRACGMAQGECAAGNYICSNGKFGSVCEGERRASAEACDGKDNDCDGRTDEGVTNACGGCRPLANPKGQACSAGAGECKAAGIFECRGAESTACNAVPRPSTMEMCDGKDNDCDDKTDEGLQNPCGGPCLAKLAHEPDTFCIAEDQGTCQVNSKWTCTADRKAVECPKKCVWRCQAPDNPTPFETVNPCSIGGDWLCVPRDTNDPFCTSAP